MISTRTPTVFIPNESARHAVSSPENSDQKILFWLRNDIFFMDKSLWTRLLLCGKKKTRGLHSIYLQKGHQIRTRGLKTSNLGKTQQITQFKKNLEHLKLFRCQCSATLQLEKTVAEYKSSKHVRNFVIQTRKVIPQDRNWNRHA